MKLQTVVTRYYLVAAIVTFAVCGILFYLLLRREITHDIDERLFLRKSQIDKMIPKIANIGSIGSSLEITKKGTNEETHPVSLTDTSLFDSTENEYLPFRQLTYSTEQDGAVYRIKLRQSLIESDDMTESILLSLFIVFSLFTGFSIGITLIINKRVFRPFYHTLELLKSYDVKTQKIFSPPETAVEEFQSLHRVLEKMTRQIDSDFKNIQEFTGNAAHELQTPLAIIISKLESLLEVSYLQQNETELIRAALRSANRLARLNKGLLLLTRIESGRFSDVQLVNFRSEIESQVDQCRELIEMKGISIRKSLDDEPEVKMNPSLATVLVSTLINNAIVHNIENGYINISTNRLIFTIENSGKPLFVDSEQLFERFKKGNQASETLGLGLAIAKKICEENGFTINYNAIESTHRISIRF